MPEPRPRISALIVARDEAANLADCLESLAWADERVVVVDASSVDRTEAIARELADRVLVRRFDDFAGQRNAALALATGDWVFAVDADERATPELASEILARLSLFSARFGDLPGSPGVRELAPALPSGACSAGLTRGGGPARSKLRVPKAGASSRTPEGCPSNLTADQLAGFRVPIRSVVLGRSFRFSGTQHDLPLRLFRRDHGRWVGTVHETVDLRGTAGQLDSHLTHRTIPDMHTFLRKIDHYTTLEAVQLRREGRPCRLIDLTLRPVWTFARLYFGKQGFRDGLEGLAFCALSGLSTAVLHWKHRELIRAGQGAEHVPTLIRPHPAGRAG